jgi:hypothetical protein
MAESVCPERSHVLVLGVEGSPRGCPRQFLRRLVGGEQAAAASSSSSPLLWTLTTKYYRTELAVRARHAEPRAQTALVEEVLESAAAGEGPHGVIVVVDGRPEEGEGLEPWRPWCVHPEQSGDLAPPHFIIQPIGDVSVLITSSIKP